jgi:tellurite resistance protein
MIQLHEKTLARIRDELLEVGQPPSVHFMRAAAEDDPFQGDVDARKRFEALFEVMFLMVTADGVVKDEERDALRGAVRGLTQHAMRTTQIEKLFAECEERSKQGRAARLAAITPTLKEDPALMDAAFSLAAALAFADSEIEDSENELINELAEALELDGERSEMLLEKLEAESD